MFLICLLHGVTGILLSYLVSMGARSQLSSFLWSLGLAALSYFGLALAYSVSHASTPFRICFPQALTQLNVQLPSLLSDPIYVQRNTDTVSYLLDLIFPIGNVFRAMAIGLNLYQLGCRDKNISASPSSWFGYGFPMAYLCIQVVFLGALIVWIDGDLSLPSSRRGHGTSSDPKINPTISTSLGVKEETARVELAQDGDLIRLVHVSKSFSGTSAVDDVSFGLGRGEILALLGPNGAGKTTICSMVRGEVHPDRGRIFLRDVNITSHGLVQQAIGVCPQFDALDLLTARGHLEFYACIKGIEGEEEVRANVEIALTQVGLTAHADKLASQLSGGNRRKLSLAIALMGDPAVLVLDEPSSSMDAAAKRDMWKVLAEEIAPGRSILLTTHSMEEVEALATRAAILSQKMLAIGTTHVLRQRYSNLYHVELVLRTAPHSTEDEMWTVEGWVREHFANATFKSASLGGQVKFMVPVSSPRHTFEHQDGGFDARTEAETLEGSVSPSKDTSRGGVGGGVGHIIELLEKHREQLGLQDYSIGAPTLERVFLGVVKDDCMKEDGQKKLSFWRRGLGRA